MKVTNSNGELLVANRASSGESVFYDHVNGYFVHREMIVVDGVPTDSWVQTAAPNKFFNPVDGKWYVNVPIFADGVPTTDKWVEST
jgi:hypothetical protein